MEQQTKKCKSCGRTLPLEAFLKCNRTADGRMNECKECRERRRKSAETSSGNPLEKFTGRQLIEELRRRGYRGTLEYVEVHKIDMSNF